MASGGDTDPTPSADEIVRVAASAAEDLILARVDRNQIEDMDITVQFEDGILDVDIYLHAPGVDADQLADDAALAAQGAVDALFEYSDG